MAVSETSICNMALGILGGKLINSFDDDTSPAAIRCRLFYGPTRDALLRSHAWRFASARKVLIQDDTDPVYEWDNQFILPVDLLRVKSIYENRFSDENIHSYALEGERFLTNDSTVSLRYVKKVTDTSKFDPLFVKVFVLLLADELIGPVAGGDKRIQKKIDDALAKLMPAVRALDSQETNTIGEGELETWNDARYSG
ncbi:hypothetical protein LCGC14_1643740 [marine sediment metagenome]|uniref:Uncharacterized protein n=1 Tax=marine sediment metagenome TaxID=412755 RepID=A0A0F9ILF2_9ZZZZ